MDRVIEMYVDRMKRKTEDSKYGKKERKLSNTEKWRVKRELERDR